MSVRLITYFFLWAVNAVFTSDPYITGLLVPTFLVCLLNASSIRENYVTIPDMFWFVYFLFFVISPMQAIENQQRFHDFDSGFSSPVGGLIFANNEIEKAALITFLFAAAVALIGVLYASASRARKKEKREKKYILKQKVFFAIVSVYCLFSVVYIMSSGGIGNLMAPRFDKISGETSVFKSAFQAGMIVSYYCLMACILDSKNGQRTIVRVLVFIVLTLVFIALINPFNTSRFGLIQTYLPGVFLLLKGRLKVHFFYALSLISMLVLMPILSLTSRFGIARLGDALGDINMTETFFRIPYIDVFDTLTYAVKYVSETGLTFGERIIGVMFFFVPRSIWNDKPELLGLEIGDHLVSFETAGTENLSFFIGGVMYSDFGFVGVFLLTILLMISFYQILGRYKIRTNGFLIRDFFLISAIPIVLRGPTGAVLPLIFMELVIYYLMLRVFYRRHETSDKPQPSYTLTSLNAS